LVAWCGGDLLCRNTDCVEAVNAGGGALLGEPHRPSQSYDRSSRGYAALGGGVRLAHPLQELQSDIILLPKKSSSTERDSSAMGLESPRRTSLRISPVEGPDVGTRTIPEAAPRQSRYCPTCERTVVHWGLRITIEAMVAADDMRPSGGVGRWTCSECGRHETVFTSPVPASTEESARDLER
jgi:hypothetical protein